MKTPTREEVIEYFKDAELIQCLNDKRDESSFNPNKLIINLDAWVQDKGGCQWLILWTKEKGYAKILKYKEGKEPTETTIPLRYSSRLVNGMDVIDLIKFWNLDFNEGNILKYLLRDKGEDIEDMNKIADYAKRQSEYLKSKS